MDRRSLLNLSLITALGLAVPCSAIAQTKPLKDQLVGTWTLMSWEQTGKDGTKAQDFSANPKGVSSFDANGHFFVMFARPDLPKIASTDRTKVTLTKSALIVRDLDLLVDLARDRLVSVMVSVTSLTNDVKRTLEPRTASPQARLRVVAQLAQAGVPVGVMVAPVIPAITDHEMEGILTAAREAGASAASYVLLRLPYEVKILFREWLAEHYPDRAKHVMSLINQSRGGKDYDSQFGVRMRGTGPYAELLRTRFELASRKLGFDVARSRHDLATDLFRPPLPATPQLSLGF